MTTNFRKPAKPLLGGESAAQTGGLLLVVLVATSFAANSTLAGLAYEGGSNALSVLTMRSAVAFVALAGLLWIRGGRLSLPARKRNAALGLGVLLALYSYGLLGAIEHMPVALAVVTFYTYPVFTALAMWSMGRERPSIAMGVVLLIAFSGLVLALDVMGQSVSAVGIAHALMAAVVVTVVFLWSDRLRGQADSRPITLYMLASSLVVYLLACLVTGLFDLPEGLAGWSGFIGSPVFYSFSIVGVFIAMGLVGPIRTALLMHLEPVASVLLGYLLLNQSLRPLQLLGVALVVIAVVAVRGIRGPAATEDGDG